VTGSVKTRDIRLDGGRGLHVVEAGSGPPLVLIHGALTTHQDWLEGPFTRLAASHRVLAIDRPGHGLSPRPRFLASPLAQANQIREGLARLDVERPALLAHSFGGLVALAWAAAHPDEVAALTLLAPIAFSEFRPLEQTLFGPRAAPFSGPALSAVGSVSIDPPLLRALQQVMFAPQEPPPGWLERFPYDQVLSPAAMVREGEDASTVLPGSPLGHVDLHRIGAPAVILTGDNDKVVDPGRHAGPLAKRLRRAELVRLPGVGHMVHHAAPDVVMAAVQAQLTPA